MSKSYLFYGTQLVAELESHETSSRHIRSRFGQEIYDGGYLYDHWYHRFKGQPRRWWRCDLTPVLLEQVPKELRALALLLT
jgi:hypothetical protein